MLRVRWNTLHDAAADCASTANSLNTTLTDLERDMARTTANWDGEAKEAYGVCEAAWRSAAADLTAQLDAMGRAVTAAAEIYQLTEQNARNGIPGAR